MYMNSYSYFFPLKKKVIVTFFFTTKLASVEVYLDPTRDWLKK